jgi:hypothetical protein
VQTFGSSIAHSLSSGSLTCLGVSIEPPFSLPDFF